MKPRTSKWRRRLRAALVGSAATAFLFVLAWFLFPYPAGRLDRVPAGVRVTDRDGRLLRAYPASSGDFRFPVPLASMSPWLGKATVAVEDRHFRSHPGVDPLAVLRAAGQNVSRMRTHSGASTLTQQIVRMLDERPRTLVSKAIEAFRALQLESQRSKDQLLEAYLNLAPYGGNVRGVEAASLRYFGKPSADLSLAEAALLAGVPQSPSRLRPDRFLARALERREVVLTALLREGLISKAERDSASREVPRVRAHDWPLEAPHFCDAALAGSKRLGLDLTPGSSMLRTSLSSESQSRCAKGLRGFFNAALPARRRLSGSVVALNARTGEVQAWVGSPDLFDPLKKGQVDAALRPRSSGSVLKPFLYALAFQNGLAAPDAYLPDSPRAFATYSPENFDGEFLGPIPASRALSLSRNSPAIVLAERVGVSSFLTLLRGLGLESLSRPASAYGLTLAVGGGEVRLADLTNAYATLARLGDHLAWHTTGAPGNRRRELNPGACLCVLEALSTEEHLRRAAPGLAARWAGALGYKTGTSFGFRDAWAVAFTSEVIVGVWLGDPTGKPHPDLIGVESAAPIALELAAELSSRPVALVDPADHRIATRPVCASTGYPAGLHCPNVISGHVPAGAPSLRACNVHCEIEVDPVSGLEVCDACVGARHAERRIVEVWPADTGFLPPAEKSSPQHDPSCRKRPAEGQPRILSPAHGSEYRLERSLAFEQRLMLAAMASSAARVLHWFVDGALVRSVSPGERVPWPLVRGEHEVRCVDDRGRGAAVRIRVR